MRHRKAGVKLNRTSSHRNAMFRNMVTSLFQHGRIKTTDAKAKELRRWADHMVTLAKRGDLHARRQALAVMRDKKVVHALFESAQERFGESNGGYTRIVKIGIRKGDAAPLSLVELVESSMRATTEKKTWMKRPRLPRPKKKDRKETTPQIADVTTEAEDDERKDVDQEADQEPEVLKREASEETIEADLLEEKPHDETDGEEKEGDDADDESDAETDDRTGP